MGEIVDKDNVSSVFDNQGQDTQPSVERFTTGEWLVFNAGTKHEEKTNYPKRYDVRSPGVERITGWGSVRTTHANACLIAAAPNLYEALLSVKRFGELACVDAHPRLAHSYTGGKKPASNQALADGDRRRSRQSRATDGSRNPKRAVEHRQIQRGRRCLR